jgi:hypothetical protein
LRFFVAITWLMNYYNYFTEVENEFVRRRGKHMLVSPLDWSLIETWKQRGVPLRIAQATKSQSKKSCTAAMVWGA